MRFGTLIVMIVVLLTLVVSLGMVQVATFTVINTSDSGAGSLRQAILEANGILGTASRKAALGSGTAGALAILFIGTWYARRRLGMGTG